MGVSDLQTLITAANAAIAGSDWATAEIKLLQAQNVLATIPDSDRGNQSMRWRADIKASLDYVRSKLSAAGSTAAGGAIQRTSVTYERADCT